MTASSTPGGPAVVLLHGFPYDPRGFDAIVGSLSARGADVVVRYLRGYGPTRFVDAGVPRSGRQAALAHDPRAVVDPTRDGLGPPAPTHEHRRHFSQIVEHRLLPVGHQLAQQAPEAFTAAVAALRF